MKKSYQKEVYDSKEEWLVHRGIGGSDAAAILNESKWLTAEDVYNRIVLNKDKKITTNKRMEEGIKAEGLIRDLFALDNPKFKLVKPPKRKYWIYRRKDYPLITCTPDSLLKEIETNKLLGLEIKDVELVRNEDKEKWESDILPNQYYYQCLHYLVTIKELEGVILVAHLKYMRWDADKKERVFEYAIDKPFVMMREDLIAHIKYLEDKEIDFITNNIEKQKRPKILIKF